MANSYQDVVSDGTLTFVDISIDYLSRSEITVYFNDVLTTAWFWIGPDNRIGFTDSPVPAGVDVKIKRVTDQSQLLYEFSRGAPFTAGNLDDDLKQALHIAQEAGEGNPLSDFFQNVNMHGFRIVNVGGPVDDTDALTFGQMKTMGASSIQLRADMADSTVNSKGGALLANNLALVYPRGTVAFDLRTAINLAAIPGMDLTGATDSTAAMNVAISAASVSGMPMHVQGGTISCNVTISALFQLIGSGSTKCVFKPFNTALPCIKYTHTGDYWSYASLVQGVSFVGAGLVGVGFCFGGMDPLVNEGGADQYVNGVTFRAVQAYGLDKAIFFPKGNIGTTFDSCHLFNNKYGMYGLDNKSGGDAMHAGNKYFVGGEISGNICGVYIDNATGGFGGVEFTGTIFENNYIAWYIKSNNTYLPLEFRGSWNEGSGTTGALTGPVSIDLWTGAVKTTQSLPLKTGYVRGAVEINATGGFWTDVDVGDGCVFKLIHSRTERTSGFGGGVFNVAGTGMVKMYQCSGTMGLSYGVQCMDSFKPLTAAISSASSAATRRAFKVAARYNRVNAPANGGVSMPMTKAEGVGAGAFSATGSVVSDGKTYPLCNEFVLPFSGAGQYVQLLGSGITSAAGWYACTVDLKVVSGTAPRVYLWDRNTVQFVIDQTIPSVGDWHTFAAIGYSPGSQSFYFDIGGTTATCNLRVGAYQLRRFDTQQEAMDFIAQGAYMEASYMASTTYDPASIATGAGLTTTLAVTGAVVGDYVEASFSTPLGGLVMNAWVSAADVVSVRLTNLTGGAVDLASGTLRVLTRRI